MTYFVLTNSPSVLRKYISDIVVANPPKKFSENGMRYKLDADLYIYVTRTEQMYGYEQFTILLLSGYGESPIYTDNIDEFVYFCSRAEEVIHAH